ncbi:efflux RND transporter permease subunit [Parapedobacter sp. 10938]|uniref:efflux RND transporter permease subunit n=1 Tax=Parapedobacter flavus TaxID=3110225 RepID=UPI002DBEF505|nr:efflux RND transporter permease subunit [Parapedobacter sp. 10938]MEC3881797.1 efflux RND transporter permease subunit [Parapedobacter sp. 10938]
MHNKDSKYFPSFSILTISLMLSLIGVALIPRLSIQLLPSHTYASITVQCSMPNASPEVTDLELTAPIERALSRLRGIKKIHSNSGAGTVRVDVQLDKWTDPTDFRLEASTVLRQISPQLPPTSTYPEVRINQPLEANPYGNDIVGYTLSGPARTADIALFAEQRLRPILAEINGIHAVSITGLKPVMVVVELDPLRLQNLGLNIDDLQDHLKEGLAKKGLGVVQSGGMKTNLVIESSISEINDIPSFAISCRDGRVFHLRDIAKVKIEEAASNSYYRINGKELVYINIAPEAHSNNIQLVAQIRSVLENVSQQMEGEGYILDLAYDNTEYIKEELEKITIRTALSVAILLLFVILITRKLRYLMIVVLSLGVNVAISLFFYYLLRLEIHLYSLAGITISLGLIIDNIIVIVDDIRHTGRNRIFAAILASTMTALGALSVIFLLEENARINLLDFAMAIIVNLLVSLPVSYFFIPSLLEKCPINTTHDKVFFKRLRYLAAFTRFYDRQLKFMIRFRRPIFVLFVLLFGIPLFMLPTKIERDDWFSKSYNAVFGSDFYNNTLRDKLNTYLGGALYLYAKDKVRTDGSVDEAGREALYVRITMPNGATLEQMDTIARNFENELKNYNQEIKRFITRVSSANHAFISIDFHEEYEKTFPQHLKQLLETKAVMSGAADFAIYGVGRGFSNAITLDNFNSTIELRGYDYAQLQAIALNIRDTLFRNSRVLDVAINSQIQWWQQSLYEEFLVGIDRSDYLVAHGIGQKDISDMLKKIDDRAFYVGNIQTSLGANSEIIIRTNAGKPPPMWMAMHAPLGVNNSNTLRLKDVATVEKVRLGDNIVRENQEYLLNVHSHFIGTTQQNRPVQERMTENIRSSLPYGYSVELNRLAGWGTDSGDSRHFWLIGVVLLIIYIICAILLGSFRQPLSVVLIIPFSFIGVFLTFHFLDLQFGQGGYASLLMLSGLVTNAALYIINDFNYIRRTRKISNNRKAFVKAFNSKAMPILITTLSAILSLLPFMISGDEDGFWFTLSAGTIGGLLFSILGAYLLLPISLLKKVDMFDHKEYNV